MSRPALLALSLLAAAITTGCTVATPYDYTARNPGIFTRLDRVAIHAHPSVADHVDVSTTMGIRETFRTGQVFAAAFAGSEDSPIEVRIISSQFRSDVQNLGASMGYSYTATIVATVDGRQHVLTSTRSAVAGPLSSGMNQHNEVVSGVVNDLAAQALALNRN